MVLDIKNLNYGYFKNINMSFQRGFFYHIAGCNNSGKTTLFKLITGIIKSNNLIICNGVLITDRENYIKQIGVVSRVNKFSFKHKKVIDELLYPLINLNISRSYALKRIDEIVNFFDIDYFNKNIDDLNIFQKQELLIIVALLHKPSVLIMDSVLNFIPKNRRIIIIKKLRLLIKENNMTIINFTTSLTDMGDGDISFILNNYNIVACLEYNDLFDNENIFYDNNIEIPFIVDLVSKLKIYNLIDENYSDFQELVDKIWE